MKCRKKYLTIEEKKELLFRSEKIPLYLNKNPKEVKKRKKELRKLNKNFSKTVSE